MKKILRSCIDKPNQTRKKTPKHYTTKYACTKRRHRQTKQVVAFAFANILFLLDSNIHSSKSVQLK